MPRGPRQDKTPSDLHATLRIELACDLKSQLNDISKKYGQTQRSQITRILEWFIEQGEAEQAAILGCNFGKKAFAQTTDLEGTLPTK